MPLPTEFFRRLRQAVHAAVPAAAAALCAVCAAAVPEPPESSPADALSAASFDASSLRAGTERGAGSPDELARPRAEAADSVREGDFWIAWEDTGSDAAFEESVAPLLESLRRSFPERRVVVSAIPSREFAQEVRLRRIPFLIATAGTMVSLMQRGDAIPLAARERADSAEGATLPAAGLLLVRADRKELLSGSGIEVLRGARLAVASGPAVGPWQLLQSRLLSDGLPADGFFGRIGWHGQEIPGVLNALQHGRADAALLSLCTWEKMVEDGVIDAKAFQPAGALPESRREACLRSTARYPDWVIGYAPSARDGLLRRLAAAVFALPSDGGCRWGLRVNLQDTQELMRSLRIGPWAESPEPSLRDLWERYAGLLWWAAAAFALLVLHCLRTNHLVRSRTRELRRALSARDAMEEQARLSRERLSYMERLGVLSQMSTMFAHELKQPLAGVANWLGGLRLWNRTREDPQGDRDMTEEALENASAEVQRAADIVERVRGYARRSFAPMTPVDWTAVVRAAAAAVERHDSVRVPVRLVPGEFFDAREDRPARVLADALELELLVLNLLRNAAQAASESPKPQVEARLVRRTQDGRRRIELRVSDNGPALTDEQFARLTGYGESLKSDGLGIGLSLCRGIADRLGGTLTFERLPGRGVQACVVLDELAEEPSFRGDQ